MALPPSIWVTSKAMPSPTSSTRLTSLAAATASKAAYIRTRAQDDEFYAKLLTDYLDKYGEASRTEINQLLLPKLSEVLTDVQKDNKIANLLTNLRRGGRIRNTGTRGQPIWKVAE